MRAILVIGLTLVGALHSLAAPLPAQSLSDRLKKKAKDAQAKVERRAEAKVDQSIDKGIDKLGECLFTDAACIKKAKANGKQVTLKDDQGHVVDATGKQLPAPTAAVADAETPVTVAAGGVQLYDALLADGRVATPGIFFETGSDRLKPESGATLKLIGDMLQEHADLKLMIEGHTDNVESATANMTLSEKRAAAVRAYLVVTLGIDEARLQSSGLGDTKPAVPNTTNEGRQQNRRIELVKM
jgi:outer membrane protein OmpA-like peptidoglycan-associated protein